MRVGVFQFCPAFGEATTNVERIESAISTEPADLWVLPELATTGYQLLDRTEAAALAEPLDGPSVRRLTLLSASTRSTVVCGFAERDGDRIFNSAFVASHGELLGVYRKSHRFEDEVDWSDPGDTGFRIFTASGVRIGVMICFDWRFPEAARTLALRGADVIAHPSNLVRPQCPEVMKTRALENGVYAATCNRVGVEERREGHALRFTGKSQVVTPAGELAFRMGDDEVGVRVAKIDVERSRDKRRGRNDLFEDRRPELYEEIAKAR